MCKTSFFGQVPRAANAIAIYNFKQNWVWGILSEDLDLSRLVTFFSDSCFFVPVGQRGGIVGRDVTPIHY